MRRHTIIQLLYVTAVIAFLFRPLILFLGSKAGAAFLLYLTHPMRWAAWLFFAAPYPRFYEPDITEPVGVLLAATMGLISGVALLAAITCFAIIVAMRTWETITKREDL